MTPWAGGCRGGSPRRSRSRRPRSWPARRWSPRSPARSASSPWPPTWPRRPAVGPATVLGLAGGLVGLVWPAAGGVRRDPGGPAAWPGSSRSPGTAPQLPTPGRGLGHRLLGARRADASLAVLVALAAPYLLRRRTTGLACCGLLVVAVLVRPPTPGWPPPGWVLVACDVGQGDALVLHAGTGSGRRRRRRTRPGGGGRVPATARRLDASRWWCSPTSTPTTSTGCRACSTARGGGGRGHPSGGPARWRRAGLRGGPRGGAAGPRPRRTARPARSATSGSRCSGRRRPRRRPGRATAAPPTTRAWCCWSRSPGCGCCCAATSSPRPRPPWPGPGPGSGSTCSRCRTTAAATRTCPSCSASEPGWRVVSVGDDNDYGHPAAAHAGRRWPPAAPRSLRTDLDGDVAVASATASCTPRRGP